MGLNIVTSSSGNHLSIDGGVPTSGSPRVHLNKKKSPVLFVTL